MVKLNYGWKDDAAPPRSCGYIAPAVITILANSKLSRILDLGCGNGALCCELYYLGFSVVGAEPSADGFEASMAAAPTVKFFNIGVDDDPEKITLEEGFFDAVVSTEVIEHLYSPHLLPAFAFKCLRPDGLLILSTPFYGYFKNLILAILGKWDKHHTALWCGGHIKFWSQKTLSRLLEDSGFSVESFHGVGRVPWLWKSMIIVARKKNSA
jgi:2-polyprenyl-3-methyl-5-hydroxy-6-metoxy-1,4-benzoquinol methylase